MGLEKNMVVRMEITGMSSTGSGVGRADGLAVFVPETAVGDEVEIKILKVKKNLAYGRLLRIITPAPGRIEQDCAAFPRCGGCAYRHITYREECAVKQRMVADALSRIGGQELEPNEIIPAVQRSRYRNKAQYPLGVGSDGRIISGFYARHSHRIAECEDCLLQPAEFAKLLSVFIKWAEEFRLPVYDELSGQGLLRHLYLRKAFSTGKILAVPVCAADTLPFADELVRRLHGEIGENLAGVVLNINKERTNVVLGEQCKTIYGDAFIVDRICGIEVELSPISFYQVNRDMTEILYKKAAEYADAKGKTLLDLYCGTGTIGLSMADTARHVIGVEVVPQAVRDAERNARRNGITNAEFICAGAKDAAERLQREGLRPDAVLLDPPRKGCDAGLIEAVARGFAPERVVYVSCDPATLARDLKLFGEYGYNMEEATPVDMFPRTPHVETVCLLSKLHSTQHIEVELEMDELDLTAAESKATYEEIKGYVLKEHGLKVSSLNISQVKHKCGIIERTNYNLPKSENSRQPKCPIEKEAAIREALEHFRMI